MKISAGILAWRKKPNLEVFLVHPGGPFWENRDEGVWSIPKGEVEVGEDYFFTAKREFEEETSFHFPENYLIKELKPVNQSKHKKVYAFAIQMDFNEKNLKSNLVFTEYHGEMISFPEVDRGEWLSVNDALKKINPGQADLIRQL